MEIIIFEGMSLSLPVLLGQMSTHVKFSEDFYSELYAKQRALKIQNVQGKFKIINKIQIF